MIAALVLAGLAFAATPSPIAWTSAADRCSMVARGVAAARHDDPRLPAFAIVNPTMTVSAVPSFCTGWTVVALMAVRDEWHSELRWIARRHRLGARDGKPTVQWLEARTCPALTDALKALDTLPITFGLDLPDKPPRPGDMVLDGTDYTVAGDAIQPDGHTARLSLAGNAGPVADWSQHMLAALEPCWSATPPVPQRSHTR